MTVQPDPSSTQSSGALSLSLPPPIYAKLLPASYLSAHLPSTRPSGRAPTTFRPSTLHTGSLTHAHGSAVIRIGDTAVVCGVRAEILKAADTDIPDDFGGHQAARIAELGLLVPNVELNTGCNPAYLPGNAPGEMAQSLTQRLLTLLRVADVVGLEELCIYEAGEGLEDTEMEEDSRSGQEKEVMAYYTLYIDVLFMSLSGSAFDAAWLAVLAALRNTRLPAARWDKDVENVLCDPRPENHVRLNINGYPAALSWSVFEQGKGKTDSGAQTTLLVDPDDFEESVCSENGCLVVDFEHENEDGRILRIEKSGGGSIGIVELRSLFDVMKTRWKEWSGLLKAI